MDAAGASSTTIEPIRVKQRFSPGRFIGEIAVEIFSFVMNTIEIVVGPLQRLIGLERMPYFFLLPNMLIFGIFVLFPMVLNFFYAFTGGTELFLRDRPYVGSANLARLFDCQNFLNPNSCNQDIFWRAIRNSVTYVAFDVGGIVIFALITALILNRNIRGRGFFRSVFFYPVLLSPVVIGLIWKWVIQTDGILNGMLNLFGGDPIDFRRSAAWMRFWVVFVSVWAQMGFYTLILLAGLQSIPRELYEAGEIDGTTKLRGFWHITLPLLKPTMLVVLVLSLIRAVQVFDHVFVLTGGGPGSATTFIVQYIFDTGFSNQIKQFGLAAAASLVLGSVLLVLTLMQLRVGNRGDDAA
ncbi:MAG: sugar ABC transporter permease [Chloroflexi bacterium]|nr:MAG: sugar ABC transporter permease [Chloroflexota bacterium]